MKIIKFMSIALCITLGISMIGVIPAFASENITKSSAEESDYVGSFDFEMELDELPLDVQQMITQEITEQIAQQGLLMRASTVQTIKTYYTKAQAKQISIKSGQVSKIADYVSYIVGLKSPGAGFIALMTSQGVAKTATPFTKAYNKGTGLEISYKYTISSGYPIIGKISNLTYTYK